MNLPTFKLQLHTGKPITEKDFKGKRVVLFSYPKAFTPGCTKEVCSIRDGFKEIKKREVEIYGISTDPVELNAKFAKEYDLPYPLICDPDHELLDKLDMYGERTLYGKKFMGVKRHIHFIDENGNIVKTIKGVKTDQTSDQILKALDGLGWD